MSKLFDQLKGAARDREGGLLLAALAKAQQRKDGTSSPPATATAAPAKAGAKSTASSHTPYAGIAVALAIFAIVILAWHSAPWRAPDRRKIDPATLKLDRNFDPERKPQGTPAPSRPS